MKRREFLGGSVVTGVAAAQFEARHEDRPAEFDVGVGAAHLALGTGDGLVIVERGSSQIVKRRRRFSLDSMNATYRQYREENNENDDSLHLFSPVIRIVRPDVDEGL